MLNSLLSIIYFRYFLIVLISFELLFIGMDYLSVANRLPDSANLQLLYSMYIGISALKITLPIAVVFGVIAAKIHLIRKNELVAIYSLGASRTDALAPFFSISLLIVIVFVFLQGIFFYDSRAEADSILKGKHYNTKASNLFLKYDNNYIYIKQLFPLQKKAEKIVIYEIKNQNLKKKTEARNAFFVNNLWVLYDITITEKPEVTGLQKEGVVISRKDTLKVLEGFKPSIMDSVHEWKENLGFSDLLSIMVLLTEQEISTGRIRGVIYSNYIVPLFAPIFVIIIFFAVPISVRFFNLALFSSGAVFLTLGGWGVIFTLSQLSATGTLQPEVAVLLPFFAASYFGWTLFKRNR